MTRPAPVASGSGTTAARLRAVAPVADTAAAQLRERLRASLCGRSDEVTVGRYVLGERLGAGGMGTVYRARDRQLERDVAVKLIPLPPEPLVERAIREARAMAGVTHPNVVEVYDVGVTERELYIVMRLMSGQTLRAWMDGEHDVAARLDVLWAAGEGLVAAHAAGFIHHDFKPDNVLIGEDGRVAVSDFGLAALSEPSTERSELSGSGLGTTEDGPVGGTLGYASPERLGGNPGDARSDQFSFCVTACEVLFGSLAGPGEGLPSRSERPGVGPVPGRVRRALQRGLSAEPAERFADLSTLLAARRAPAKPWLVAVGLAVAGVCGVGLAFSPGSSAQGLAVPPAQDPETPTVGPSSAHASIQEALDAFNAARKVGSAAEALEHAERARALVEPHPSEPLRGEVELAWGRALELSNRIDEAIEALTATVEGALARGDDGLAAKAAGDLAWIYGLRKHEIPEGRRWAQSALTYLERGGDLIGEGTIHYQLGNMAAEEGELDAARAHFEEAIARGQGELTGDHRGQAAVMLALSNLDLLQGHFEVAEARLRDARELLWRAGDDADEALARVHSLLAQLAHERGKYGDALRHFDDALAVYERTQNPLRIYDMCNAARVLVTMMRLDDAAARADEALTLADASYGETAIETAVPLGLLAHLEVRRGNYERANALAWRKMLIHESVGRTETSQAAATLQVLGEIAFARGEVDRAIEHTERSLKIRRDLQLRPAAIAATLMVLAEGLREHGRSKAAVARAWEAVEVLEAGGEDASGARRFIASTRARARAPVPARGKG